MLFGLSIPAIVSNITVPLLGLSDTFITGHLGSEVYVASIAVGTMLVNALYWLCGFLRMGTTGLAAEAYGKGDAEHRKDILMMSLMIGLGIGIGLMILSEGIKYLLMALMSPPAEVGRLAGRYFMVSIMGAPAILATMSIVGWMVGSQNTTYPMIISIGVNVINIAVSFLLVFGMDMGFIGVAYGTLIANWIGFVAALIFVKRMLPGREIRFKVKGLMKRVDAGRFFKVNGNLFVRSACLMSVSFALTSYAGQIGENALAVNAVLMQFFFFFSYFMDGFAFGGEALCGRFMGAGEGDNLKRSVRVLGIVSGCVAVVFTIIYYFFTPEIASLITDVEEVIAGIRRLEWVAWLLPAFSVGAFMYDGVYVGLTATDKMMWATMAGAAIFFGMHYGYGYLESEGIRVFTPEGNLWLGYMAFLLTRGVVLAACLKKEIKERI